MLPSVRVMKAVVILWLVACGAPPAPAPATPVAIKPAVSPCQAAYADYAAEWRIARTDDLREHMEGYEDLMEEIIRDELATTPSRREVTELREIYAVIEAFLWNAPWPRALSAAELAIERCGEKSLSPG